MSDALNFTEIDGQHIELLPGRTVMSVFRTAVGGASPAAGGGAGGDKGGTNALSLLQKVVELAGADKLLNSVKGQ